MISVIIPLYNCEKYVGRCLDSLYFQTFRDMEIIIIDDHSTDDSISIVKKYRNLLNLKLIYHDINKGAAVSRREGVEISTGKYVFFMDSDDWIEPNTLEMLYREAEKNNSDIVFCNWDRMDDNYNTIICFEYPEELFLNRSKIDEIFLIEMPCFWGKLYNRQWFISSDLRFFEGASFDEDMIAELDILLAEKVAYVNESLYHWRYRDDSVSNSNGIHYCERYEAGQYVIREAIRLGIQNEYNELIEYAFIRCFIIWTIEAIIDYGDFDCKELKNLIEYAKETEYSYLSNYYVISRTSDFQRCLMASLRSTSKFKNAYYQGFDKFLYNHLETIKEICQLIIICKLKAVIWGAGRRTRALYDVYPDFFRSIELVIDKNIQLKNTTIGKEIRIYSPEILDDNIDIIFVMNHSWIKEIETAVSHGVLIAFDNLILSNKYKDDIFKFLKTL